MCGIAGYCDFKNKYAPEVIQRMTDVLGHRGPDDKGYQIIENSNTEIGFGHRRLSILDLSAHGHQPMTFDGLTMVFNGEIYNFKSIKKELEDVGYFFTSNSDTEVIIKGYHCWGAKVVEKFIGMFAIAILDRKNHEIILIRDRAGVKPLYYYWDDDLLLFASELKSFYTFPKFPKSIDYNSLGLFLQYSYIPNPHTIFHKTYKLRPGHILNLSLSKNSITETKYWDAVDAYNKPKINISENDALAETERKMLEAYEYRMVSDVPVGLFLSGGYDSSSVAALLQSNRTEKLKTFTIGYQEAEFNEAEEAKAIANYLGTDHQEWYITANDAGEILSRLPEIYDEPFADNSTVPTVLVSLFARQQVKVALSADGGDEIFGGYNKFNQSIKYTTILPKWAQNGMSSVMSLINPDRLPILNKKYNFSTRYEKIQKIWAEADPVASMKYISQYITESEANKFLLRPFENYKTRFDASREINNHNDALNRMLAIDYQTFLVDNNLVKVDRATMSVGLEGREPMLDHNLIEFLSSLPSDLKIRNGINKYLLKKIVHKYIPSSLMDRPKKPFIAPLNIWFKNSLREQISSYLNEHTLKNQKIFNAVSIMRYRDKYLQGENVNYQKLWNILVFQLWYHKWMIN